MTRLFAMCGLSFSGKTTLASRAISEVVDAEYIGLDNINDERELRGGEGIPAEEWEKSSFIAVKRLETLLDAGRNVVLDDTLCFRWLRDRYAGVADRCGARFVLIYVFTPLPKIYDAMARNAAVQQRNPIRAEVFEAQASSFESPTPDERPLVYDRSAPLQAWIETHLITMLDDR